MLWEQQSVLSKLGTSEEAAQVRAKMQSMSLLSDMQAFKVCGGDHFYDTGLFSGRCQKLKCNLFCNTFTCKFLQQIYEIFICMKYKYLNFLF